MRAFGSPGGRRADCPPPGRQKTAACAGPPRPPPRAGPGRPGAGRSTAAACRARWGRSGSMCRWIPAPQTMRPCVWPCQGAATSPALACCRCPWRIQQSAAAPRHHPCRACPRGCGSRRSACRQTGSSCRLQPARRSSQSERLLPCTRCVRYSPEHGPWRGWRLPPPAAAGARRHATRKAATGPVEDAVRVGPGRLACGKVYRLGRPGTVHIASKCPHSAQERPRTNQLQCYSLAPKAPRIPPGRVHAPVPTSTAFPESPRTMPPNALRSAQPTSLIGAPTDIGAGARGASMGPEALRVAGLQAALESHGPHVVDRGNLSGPANPWQPPVDGYRHLPEVVEWNQRVFDAVYAELQLGHLPILLGGDHCLGLGSISAVARHCAEMGKKLRVLWLDAHADFNTSALTPSGNVHGMPVACLCGFGPEALTGLARMPGGGAALHPSQIRQIGIRSVDAGEKRFVHEQGLEVFDMRYIDEVGMRQTMQQALAGLDAHTHLHVSFDVDFLDPDIAPGVGTTVPGGPTYREAQLCMEMIADSGRLASLDIVELNPALDVRNRTAVLAVDLVESLFGKSTLMRTSP